MSRVLGVTFAVLAHVAILLFGGLLFLDPDKAPASKKVEVVDLVAPAAEEEKDEQASQEPAETEQAEAELQEQDTMPDLRELAALDAAAAAPKLEAMSLSALSDMLNDDAGAGGFYAGGADLTSGGRIGGTGSAIAADLESVFSIAEIDQRPRAILQSSPVYPQELRRKKVEGKVLVLLVVNQEGGVVDPWIETSSDPAFDRPALEAVRRWKFEPAVRGGKRVQCKIRVPIRFSIT